MDNYHDTTGGCRDTGVVFQVYEDCYGDNIYSIYWLVLEMFESRNDYTTILSYTEEELDMEYSHCFEVIELNKLFS